MVLGSRAGHQKRGSEKPGCLKSFSIQYSEKIHERDELIPDFEGEDDDSFSLHQNPTKTPIISKIIL